MKRVLIIEEESTIHVDNISEAPEMKYHIATNGKVYMLLVYEPARNNRNSGWIFRAIDSVDGHSGYHAFKKDAIKSLIKGWTCYEFDKLIDAFNWIFETESKINNLQL